MRRREAKGSVPLLAKPPPFMSWKKRERARAAFGSDVHQKVTIEDGRTDGRTDADGRRNEKGARRREEKCRKWKSTCRPHTRCWNLWNLQSERTKYAAAAPLKPLRLVIVCSVEMNYTCDPIKAPSASAGAEYAQQVSTHVEGVIHGGGRAGE